MEVGKLEGGRRRHHGPGRTECIRAPTTASHLSQQPPRWQKLPRDNLTTVSVLPNQPLPPTSPLPKQAAARAQSSPRTWQRQ